MNKIYPVLFLVAFLGLSIVSASIVPATSISIDSVAYKDRAGNTISNPQNLGDQIWAEITVSHPDIFQDLRYPYLTWVQPNNPNAWVSCNSRWDLPITSTDWHWRCILTVTPQMSQTSDVYIKTNTRSGDNANVYLGTFDFRGKLLKPTKVKICRDVEVCKKRSWNGTCLISKVVYSCKTITVMQ